jgi:diguanylate cyclase
MKPGKGHPRQGLGLPARVAVAVVAVYGVAGLLVAASLLWGSEGPYAASSVDEVVKVLCLVFAAACTYRAARLAVGRRRYGWLALVTALLGWAVGESIWAVHVVRSGSEYAANPATADGVLLLSFPVGVVAALVLLSKSSQRIAWRMVLDGVIVATSLFVLSWVFVLDKLIHEDSNSGPGTLTHVVADVVIITTAILVLSRDRPGRWPSLSLAAGGIAIIGVADIVMLFLTGIGTNHAGALADLSRWAK